MRHLTDDELDSLIHILYQEASVWFNNTMILKLEELIRETRRLRAVEDRQKEYAE